MPYPVEALADRNGHSRRLRLTGQRSEFLNELVGLSVLDIKTHDPPFYPTAGTRVPYVMRDRGILCPNASAAQNAGRVEEDSSDLGHDLGREGLGQVTGLPGPNGAGKARVVIVTFLA
ncbi:MAG: hypothetical protein ACRDOH_26670 [Streptosporangiaceae bacterium]